jgi:hypothetical protein
MPEVSTTGNDQLIGAEKYIQMGDLDIYLYITLSLTDHQMLATYMRCVAQCVFGQLLTVVEL